VLEPWLGLPLLGLAVLGFLDALYFVLVTYRWMRPDPPWLPRVCRLDEGTCARIVDTRHARVLGLPNAVFGLAWYGIAGVAGAWMLAGRDLPFCGPILAASLLTVALSAYLAWALVVRLRVACTLCFLGHGVNVALLLVLAAACV